MESVFLGTMLFIGNISEGTAQQISVVDSQQRLTTCRNPRHIQT